MSEIKGFLEGKVNLGTLNIKNERVSNFNNVDQESIVFGPDFFEVIDEWVSEINESTERFGRIDWGALIPVIRDDNGIVLTIELHWSEPLSADLGDTIVRVSETFFSNKGLEASGFASDDRVNLTIR